MKIGDSGARNIAKAVASGARVDSLSITVQDVIYTPSVDEDWRYLQP